MMDEPIVEETPEVEPTEAPIEAARLVYVQGGAETETVFEVSGSAVVGRFDPSVGPVDVDCGPLAEGNTVSRRHARIEPTENGWSLTDLGSSNGSYVLRNGDFERVEAADLTDGDQVAFGNARFTFRIASASV